MELWPPPPSRSGAGSTGTPAARPGQRRWTWETAAWAGTTSCSRRTRSGSSSTGRRRAVGATGPANSGRPRTVGSPGPRSEVAPRAPQVRGKRRERSVFGGALVVREVGGDAVVLEHPDERRHDV